ncbi:transient receptor potential cation channel subfamily M member 2-like isoform X1 [Haliotis rubra]|uniref:transient receptor potential cation channel subfamily M member 2-like isoform X1 n=2 Tax=Haliotis rubra TaxID=36100 RepID=UPI001EE5FC4C|nr:transient receptor potential cation channel subfamily M member 2-like isoform X1 [Haliotis rubra]
MMELLVPEIRINSEMTSSHWIAENIRCRECYRAVRVKPGVDICKCFRKLEDHERLTDVDCRAWSKEKNTQTSRTNAYGDAVTKSTNGKVLSKFKYVRVDEDTDMDTTRHLLLDVWQMPPPDWILSVMGEVVEVQDMEQKEEKFSQELKTTLSNIASNSVVWLVTEGLDEGLSCLAGDAAAECRTDEYLCDRIIPLGVMSWGDLESSEGLLNSKRPKSRGPAEYVIQSGIGDQLGKSITHSLLVDNGTRNPVLCNTSFQMFWLNMALNVADFNDDSSSIPLVTLMYGGWSYILDGIKRSLLEDIPIVIVKGSGGIADILATGYKESHAIVTGQGKDQDERWRTGTVMDSTLRQKLRRRIERFQRQKKGVEEVLHAILQCLQKRYLLTVYDMDNPGDNLLRAVLQALLKTKKTHELLRLMDQFFSTPVYDQKSFAKFGNLVLDDMFQSERGLTDGKKTMELILFEAILMERVEIVEFIIDFEGVDFKGFFTNKRLGELYDRARTLLPKALIDDLDRHQKHETPWRVQHYVDSRIPSFCKIREEKTGLLLDSKSIIEKLKLGPFHELFLWAVLSNKSTMAQFFWKRGKDLIVSALVASTILRSIATSNESINEKNKLKEHADQFLSLAIGTIDGCYNEDKERTLTLLSDMQRKNHWRVNLLKIALTKVNRRVFSTLAYRNYIKYIWMGSISQDTGLVRIAIGTLCMPLIPCLITFKTSCSVFEEAKPQTDMSGLETMKGRGLRQSQEISSSTTRRDIARLQHQPEQPLQQRMLSPCQKIGVFYSSPIVKYYLNFVFYAAFLLLFAIIIMTHLEEHVSVLEGVLLVWIFSFFVEKGYQFVTSIAAMNIDNPRFIDYLKNFYSDKWNILDTVSLFGFVLGFCLRLIPIEKPFEAGRLILSIDFICYFWRLLHIFTITKRIGPMLVMIWKMMMDLVPFLVILMVSILSYAVASEAIMYPNTPWSLRFVLFIPRKAFFSIFGEFFLDEIEATPPDCDMVWPYSNSTNPRCPKPISKYAVPLLMSMYILITNVLLLNIIIARFNYTFQTIHELTDEIWAWQSVRLTFDYHRKPPVPPPFTLVWRFCQLCRYCCCCCRRKATPESQDANGKSPRVLDSGGFDGAKSLRSTNNLAIKRTASDNSIRSRMSEKYGEGENGDPGMRTLNRGDLLVKSRSRTDLLKSMSRSDLILASKAEEEECASVADDTDNYIDVDFETEIETMGDFERSMGEIHLAVRPMDLPTRSRKHEQPERRPISVIRPTIRMKRMASRETEA